VLNVRGKCGVARLKTSELDRVGKIFLETNVATKVKKPVWGYLVWGWLFGLSSGILFLASLGSYTNRLNSVNADYAVCTMNDFPNSGACGLVATWIADMEADYWYANLVYGGVLAISIVLIFIGTTRLRKRSRLEALR
jgi:hypothetical protein